MGSHGWRWLETGGENKERGRLIRGREISCPPRGRSKSLYSLDFDGVVGVLRASPVLIDWPWQLWCPCECQTVGEGGAAVVFRSSESRHGETVWSVCPELRRAWQESSPVHASKDATGRRKVSCLSNQTHLDRDLTKRFPWLPTRRPHILAVSKQTPPKKTPSDPSTLHCPAPPPLHPSTKNKFVNAKPCIILDWRAPGWC